MLLVQVIGCRQFCWTTAPPLTFVHWLLPLLWDFHRPILGHPYRPSELMTGLRGQLLGTLTTHVLIGPVRYSILFKVLSIQSSFNLLLGRPWIHEAGSIPSSLHQKVKFIHKGRIITIQSDTDVTTSLSQCYR